MPLSSTLYPSHSGRFVWLRLYELVDKGAGLANKSQRIVAKCEYNSALQWLYKYFHRRLQAWRAFSHSRPSTKSQATWSLFRAMVPNQPTWCNAFHTVNFQRNKETQWVCTMTAVSGHKTGRHITSGFTARKRCSDIRSILCFRMWDDDLQILLLVMHYNTDYGTVKTT